MFHDPLGTTLRARGTQFAAAAATVLGVLIVALVGSACTKTVTYSAPPDGGSDPGFDPANDASEGSTEEGRKTRGTPDAGPGDGATDAGQDGGHQEPKPGVELSVSGVEATLKIGDVSPTFGRELLLVLLKVTNVDAMSPLSLNYPLFTLSTSDALNVSPEPTASAALVKGCPQNTSIKPGGMLECVLAFEVTQDTAEELHYQLPSGDTVSAKVPPAPRCNTLQQKGTLVSFVLEDIQPPASYIAPPFGTYATSSGARSSGPLLHIDADTMRIAGNTIERVTISDGVQVRSSATFSTAADGVTTLTYTCITPSSPDWPMTGASAFGYDDATNSLESYFGDDDGNIYMLRYKKTN